jgi:2-dehydropantoate 2-reductase
MEITIIGAGAIGGVLGAYLARAGEQITFCDVDPDHVKEMNETGLEIEGPDETFTVPVNAFLPEDLLQRGKPFEMVFLCVKAQHTEEALKPLLPLVQGTTSVVSFQNGLCENIISRLIGRDKTVGCFVNFSADYLGPGRILYGGVSSVYIGELEGRISRRVLDLQHTLHSSWGPVEVTDNIWGYLWGKLSYAGLLYATALVDETMAAVVRNEDLRETLLELCSEILEVADKENITPQGFDDWEPHMVYPREKRNYNELNPQLEKLAHRMATNKKTKSGIWRDLAVRKRPTEIDYHLLPIVEIGEKYGLSMPLTSWLIQSIKQIEQGERQMDWSNLYELKEIFDTKLF